ncbi:hypothetical protein [Arenicella xantha]|uniref:Uncharacterized protein n=1 Tax=Arenicella xantha TaxID=644221 RepID=A0A395JM07_9GAMM|nr:hypothetical protein [Arenicella xantha]RBP50698.1 hypothetical protein DFR28_102109 [Arenicella xantha]
MRNDNPMLVKLSTILWVSFLSAGIATMLFFATFDPLDLAQIATFPMEMERSAGYSFGFLLFWGLLSINGFFITWLMSLGQRKKQSPEG